MAKKHFAVSIITILVFAIIGAGVLFYQMKIAKEVTAGASDNVSGWAWSENIGWLSFNNITGGGGTNYGVHICRSGDTDPRCANKTEGDFVGYAWSENIGWIDFAPPGPYPTAPNYSAKVNMQTKEVSGWARAVAGGTAGSGGWDGWIKLRGVNYGVSIDDSTTPAQFRGWAWGGDDNSSEAVIGWLSFNCANPETGNVCSTSNYKVETGFTFNKKPEVQNLLDPDQSDTYCNLAPGLGQVVFNWTYTDGDGDPQTKFDFQVDDNPNFTSPEVNREIKNLNNPSPSSNSQTVQVKTMPTSPGCDYITYGRTYYWRVKVYDNKGGDSGWITNSALAYRTPRHALPWPAFSYTPENPAAGELIDFNDESICFDNANNQRSCPAVSTYSWNFGDGTTCPPNCGTEPDASQYNPYHIYSQAGNYDISLSITDTTLSGDDDCTCTVPGIRVNVGFPEWREIIPY